MKLKLKAGHISKESQSYIIYKFEIEHTFNGKNKRLKKPTQTKTVHDKTLFMGLHSIQT